jgi:hypothetical protein
MSMVELLLDPASENWNAGNNVEVQVVRRFHELVLSRFLERRSGEDRDGGNCQGVPRLEASEFAGAHRST